jgi:hypothetical protein
LGKVYGKGSANAICDICGFQYKNWQLRRNWKGHMVCDADFETRHPMDLIRPHPPEKPLPWTRPEQPIVSVVRWGEVDVGTVDYAIVGRTLVRT